MKFLFDEREAREWEALMKSRGCNIWFYMGWFPLDRTTDGLGIVILGSYVTIAVR